MSYRFKLAKKGFGLLSKNKKSTDTIIQVKPSGKKTETEKYLKNRKKPTTYKGPEKDDFKDVKEDFRRLLNERKIQKEEELINKFMKIKRPKKKYKPSPGIEALNNLKKTFNKIENTPEMKAYRKKENWPRKK